VWEGKLDNPDAAGEILEKILAREPGSVAALTRLSKIYERSGDWDKCKATLEQALKLNPQGSDAADLFFRLGEVARVGDTDDSTAIQHYQQALRYDANHPASITALEKLARDKKDNVLLADMLARRVARVTDPAERVTLLVEVADLERKAGRNDAALTALVRASKDAPEDIRVLGPLGDLYFATGRLDEAAPIFDKLATEAKAARRMKDVARFRQRQGGILEARGDRAGALAAYEEALRVNPTDVHTMTGLGRLYFEASDWEKARKIYQSLVLQNFESDVGVTKGEVYLALGKIHIELGQSPKAKSMFQRGLELEPSNQRLRDALAQLG
jgi:tetratricopeptide (TPR) repeat protein